MRVVAVVVGLSACSFAPGKGAMQPPDDGAIDAAIDATDAMQQFDAAIDAMPDARMCPAAPPTCTAFKCAGSSRCYYVCGSSTSDTGRLPWSDARDACVNAHVGCIVTINSQAEQDCVAQQAAPVYPNTVWFGLVQSASGSEPAGGWGWACGPSSYVSPGWGSSEPNNQGGSEDCGSMTTGGGWNDAECGDDMRCVCELP